MRLTVIESPFASATPVDGHTNRFYLQEVMRDSLRQGEAPFASHRLYTRALDDRHPEDRALGIAAGLAWGAHAELVAVYVDRGISRGMLLGIEAAVRRGTPVEYRCLPTFRWALERSVDAVVPTPEEREMALEQPFLAAALLDGSYRRLRTILGCPTTSNLGGTPITLLGVPFVLRPELTIEGGASRYLELRRSPSERITVEVSEADAHRNTVVALTWVALHLLT